MFCGKCGNEINENEGFCANCGEPIANQITPDETSAYTPDTSSVSTTGFKFDSKKANLIAIVSSVIMFIMTFLPYATLEFMGMSESITLTTDGGDGIFFIIIALLGLFLGLLGNKKGLIVVGIIACALTLFEVIDFANIADEMGAYSDMLSRGIGFWLMILSSAGLLASPFVEKYIPKKEETENNFM